MPIELQYENRDSLPEAFREESVFKELFTVESDGKIVLTGVTGMKTQADVDDVREALRKEREDHGQTKTSLKAWGKLDPTETLAKLDRIGELETAAGGKLDDDAINKIVEGRLEQRTAPLQRKIDELTETNGNLTTENGSLKGSIETRDRNDIIRKVALGSKIHPTAMADVESAAASMFEKDERGQWITKADVAGVTAGQTPEGWLRDMQKVRPHWWPESQGGGALGGGAGGGFSGPNPWTAENWNMTKQAEIFREQGSEVAERMAKAAGTKVGGTKPAAKK